MAKEPVLVPAVETRYLFTVSTLAEIEDAVAKLPSADFQLLLQHMKERAADEWDRQIEQDAESGRLDALYARLCEEDGDLPKVPLDEVVDDPQFS